MAALRSPPGSAMGVEATANLAAFASASGLVVAANRGARNPNHRSLSCHAPCGIESLHVRMKDHNVQIFPATHPVVDVGFHGRSRPASTQRHAGVAGCLFA